MKLPPAILALRERVDREVAAFYELHAPAGSKLLLDSTGPSITRQYIVLSAIGLPRLREVGEVHAFSGSVYALFGFLAFASGNHRVSIDALCARGAERVFRDQHHAGRAPGLRALARLATGRPAFPSPEPVVRSLEYMFGDFVERPFSAFGERVFVYLARARDEPLRVLSNNDRCSPDVQVLREAPIKQVIALAANVPFVYGGRRGAIEYFDAVYARGYGDMLRAITATGGPTLISTPWREGRKDQRHFLKCYPEGHARWAMLKDFFALVGARPNRTWSHDIQAAFKRDGVGPRTDL